MSETIEQVKTATTTALKDGYEKFTAGVAELTTHGKANFDALVESTQIAGKGAEEVGTLAATYLKTSLEKGVEVAKTLTAAKSLQEAVEVQADYAKASTESFLAYLNSLTDLVTASAKDTVKPLSERGSAVLAAVQAAR